MPRFHFNVHDGKDYPDPEGTELEDLEAARRQAVQYAGELMRDQPEAFWGGAIWTMTVTDDAGLTLFVLTFMTSIAPSTMKATAASQQR